MYIRTKLQVFSIGLTSYRLVGGNFTHPTQKQTSEKPTKTKFNGEYNTFPLFGDKMDILFTNLGKINLDDVNFDENNCETIIHLRLLTWQINNKKHLKKDMSEREMTAAWHSSKYWDWCMPEDQKKKIEPTFTNENCYTVGNSQIWWIVGQGYGIW